MGLDQGFGSIADSSPSYYTEDPYIELKSLSKRLYNEGKLDEFLEVIRQLKVLGAV